MRQLWTLWILLWAAAPVFAAVPDQPPLISISADIVEISGSMNRAVGFNWGPFQTGISFKEGTIPGLIHIGDFARQTALQASLQMMETEGKAQTLSNPKVIVQSGQQANFVVGGEQPYPVVNVQGVGVDFKKIATILNAAVSVDPNRKDRILANFQLEVSNPNFSQTVQVGGSVVPSITTRQIQTSVEVRSGETLVIGGLKTSSKNVTKTRVPYLGRIPLLGLLFTQTTIQEQQSTLFLFITLEIVK
jgi:pilus assembly protein CpaC